MSAEKKIAIIIPYFGNWPEWIHYFLHSCIRNPSIDWLFPNDCPDPGISADNLKFIPFSLRDFNELSTRKLGLNIQIKYPYKICDLKPAYGELFSEYVEGYDFWGYGDLDLVYGNIREFFPDRILNEYDVISNHQDLVTGHFCLLKNTSKLKELFRSGDAYKSAFRNNNYVGFDEQLKKIRINPDPMYLDKIQNIDRRIHQIRYGFIKCLRRIIPQSFRPAKKNKTTWNLEDFSSIVKYTAQNKTIRVLYKKSFESDLMLAKQGEKNWEVRWKDGNLTNKAEKSLLYFHFILSKKSDSFRILKYTPGIEAFQISPNGIENK